MEFLYHLHFSLELGRGGPWHYLQADKLLHLFPGFRAKMNKFYLKEFRKSEAAYRTAAWRFHATNDISFPLRIKFKIYFIYAEGSPDLTTHLAILPRSPQFSARNYHSKPWD